MIHRKNYPTETTKPAKLTQDVPVPHQAIVPLAESFNAADLLKVKVENRWTEGTTTRVDKSCKMCLPVCDDPSKKELFFCVIDQFLDAMSSDRLHLTTGSERYTKFRLVMEGSLRLSWQTLSAARAAKSTASFAEDLRKFIALYFAPMARDDQLEYLRNTIKPHEMTTDALSARLRVVAPLGRLLPGSYDATTNTNAPLCRCEDCAERRKHSSLC